MSKVIMEPASSQTREELVANYKRILQEFINRRPSGTRIKIANALNKNKSFVSQITNPSYTIPVPAIHLGAIFDICRFSGKERETFLKAYTAAHPNYQYRVETPQPEETGSRQLVIEVPIIDDPDRQSQLEEMIKNFADQIFSLVKSAK